MRRRSIALFQGAVLALTSAAPGPADNVVSNGDFSEGLSGWTIGTVATSFGGSFPEIHAMGHGNCVVASYGASANINVPSGADGYIQQTVQLPAGAVMLTFETWGEADPTNATVSVVDAGGPHVVDSFVPPPLFPCVGFFDCHCVGSAGETRMVDLSAYAGQTVGIRFEATSGGINGTFALFDNIRIEGEPPKLLASLSVDATEVLLPGELNVTLQLTNDSAEPMQSIHVANLVQAGEAQFDVLEGPAPAELASLEAGGVASAAFRLKAKKQGEVVFTGTASGMQGDAAVTSNVATSEVVRVRTITVDKIEPVQTIYGVDLVSGKPTLLRATITSSYPEPKTIAINTTVTDPSGEALNVTESVELKPGENKLLLPRAGYFKPAGAGKAVVTLDADHALAPADDRLRKEASLTVNVVAPLKLHFIPIGVKGFDVVDIFTNESVVVNVDAMSRAELMPAAEAAVEFLNAVYPMPPLPDASQLFFPQALDVEAPYVLLLPKTNFILNRLSQWCYFSGTEKLIAFTPAFPKIHTGRDVGKQSMWEAFGEGSTTGEAKRDGKPGMVVSYQTPGKTDAPVPGVVAHELGHTFGLPLLENGATASGGGCAGGLTECEEYSKFGEVGRPAAEGVWVAGRDKGWTDEQIQIAAPSATTGARNFMGNFTSWQDGQSITTWVALDDYYHLSSELRGFFRDPEALILSMTIGLDGQVTADPWYTIWTQDLTPPDPQGAYRVRMLSAAGERLTDFPFNVRFYREMDPPPANPEIDVAAVTLAVQRPAGLARVQIVLNEQVLFERAVSAATPSVSIEAPAGGETLHAGSALELSWTGSDADGDALTYTLTFSDDDGATWRPLALDLVDSTLMWTAPDVGTRTARIRVLASDGLNTFEIASQPFTIVGGGGQGLIASAGAARQVPLGEAVQLDARASRDSADLEAALEYAWRLSGAPGTDPVALSDPASPNPTFTPAVEGVYVFELTVRKGEQVSRPASVAITALAGEVTEPPAIHVQPALEDAPGESPMDESPLAPMGCAPCGATPAGMLLSLMMLLGNGKVRRGLLNPRR